MKTPPALSSIFEKYLPPAAIQYCISLWQENPFHFYVKAPRKTKLGDFRFRKDQKIQTITLNADLNPYQFLLTYIHEVAHHHAFAKFGTDHAPHGKVWKQLFQKLLEPVLTEEVFPRDILVPLRLHMKNPAASSSRDIFLLKEISKYDHKAKSSSLTFLIDLTLGQNFILQGRKFTKKETRRTRVLCEEVDTGKKYLIATMAKVMPA